MNTRKDYWRAVVIIRRDTKPKPHRATVVAAFVNFFKDDNPRFNIDRFLDAVEKGDA